MIFMTDTNSMFLWIFFLVVSFSCSEHLLLVFTLIIFGNYPAHFSMDASRACFLLFTRPCSNKKKVKGSSYTDLLLISEFFYTIHRLGFSTIILIFFFFFLGGGGGYSEFSERFENIKGALLRYFSVILQCWNMFLHHWKPKNNDAVLLPRTLSLHQNHLLPTIT